jgi:hypothetical protein
LLVESLRRNGVPHRLVELPWANHTFDFVWGGWGSQITRSALGEFLENSLDVPAKRNTLRIARQPGGTNPYAEARSHSHLRRFPL